MKGQAFVGMPDTEVAGQALQDTNGYLLHGKPMVVVSWDVGPFITVGVVFPRTIGGDACTFGLSYSHYHDPGSSVTMHISSFRCV